jgi:hypothetical protein
VSTPPQRFGASATDACGQLPLASTTLPMHLELQIFDKVFRRRKKINGAANEIIGGPEGILFIK